jgi:hypothetical protein
VKTVTRISAIGALLAASVTAASAQMLVPDEGPGPLGPYYGAPMGGWNNPDPNHFRGAVADPYFTPPLNSVQEQRDIEAQGNG